LVFETAIVGGAVGLVDPGNFRLEIDALSTVGGPFDFSLNGILIFFST